MRAINSRSIATVETVLGRRFGEIWPFQWHEATGLNGLKESHGECPMGMRESVRAILIARKMLHNHVTYYTNQLIRVKVSEARGKRKVQCNRYQLTVLDILSYV